MFAYGSGGNGKGTLLNALRAAIGDYGMTLAPRILTAAKHDEHPTGIADLRGARLVTTTETDQGRFLAEGLVKELTGGDPIRARRMRADYFEFAPTHKLWMAGNHLPRVQGTDFGIWRRIALVPFEVTFQINNAIPEELDDEAPGILAWMVEGCLEWQRGGLHIPDRVRKATENYRTEEDHVGRFLADCAVVGETEMVTAAALRERYLAWAKAEGEHEWSDKRVAAELVKRGFDSARTGPRSARIWLGFGLVSEPSATHRDGFSVFPYYAKTGACTDNGEKRRDASRHLLTSTDDEGSQTAGRAGEGASPRTVVVPLPDEVESRGQP
jgi:putative DNA primase/helicase